jgi:MFS family permease
VCDRIGKGVRGAPRDAMLATWATAGTRGKVYGFHRAMDHLGAVVGPILASLFLLLYPGQYRTLFALTIVPGAIAVLLILLIREGADGPREAVSRDAATSPARLVADDTRPPVPSAPVAVGEGPVPSARVAGGEGLPRQFHLFMGVLGVFTLGNSTDAFLLLRLTDVAGSVRYVPLMWAGLHVVKSVVSIAGGSWSDRIGRRTVIAVGWLIYAAVYVGFALATTLPVLLGWFMLYGLYFGFTEGTEKALVADLAPASRRGTAFGIFTAVQGLGALAASVLFGVVWKAYGVAPAFATGAALALVATGLLFVVIGPTTVEEPRA